MTVHANGSAAEPRGRSMRIQLWSYNYDPEPSGIAPLSGAWARGMQARGHDVDVVAAHPHYPEPVWGRRIRPYRERRDDISVLRLPLWIGRGSTAQRLRQELSFGAALSLTAPTLGSPEVIVAATPSFPALLPALVNARLRRIPWVCWVHDVLPDGASTTGLLSEGPVLEAARRFERLAYRSAAQIIVISEAAKRNLEDKGVPPEKVHAVYVPAPSAVAEQPPERPAHSPARVLMMGNLGLSQGIAEVVGALDSSGALERSGAVLRIAGSGVAEPDVRAAISTDRVEMLGLLLRDQMDAELKTTTLGIVTTRPDVVAFNLPSRMMNFLAEGIPVLVAAHPDAEIARMVDDNGLGWIADIRDLGSVPAALERALASPAQLRERGARAHAYALEHLSADAVARRTESILASALDGRR